MMVSAGWCRVARWESSDVWCGNFCVERSSFSGSGVTLR